MGEDIIEFDGIRDTMQGIIKVIGVGGGGCNAVRNMYNEGIGGVTYAVCNTDSQSLSRSPVPVKIMLGESGLGAGANPELGKKEAEANINDIQNLLSDGTKMVFVTAGMGGGTGTGAAPVIAGVAKDVEELRKNVDALLIVNNERLCDVYADSDLSVKEAFFRADNILMDAVKGISELITLPSDGGIKSDFRDVETTMKNGGGAIMAMGRANGEHRVERAIIDALDSPLLYGNDIGKAKRILFNIYASDEHPIFVRELQEIDDFFDQLDPNIDVIWGTATDDSLGEDAKVTILATGMEDSLKTEVETNVHQNEDDYYEDLIRGLYKPPMKTPTIAQVITQQELPFEVDPAPEPEPAVVQESEVRSEGVRREGAESQESEEPTILYKWKKWMTDLMNVVTE